MANLQISKLVPKLTDKAFEKNIKTLGISKYTVVSATSVLLYSSIKARPERAEMLKAFASLFDAYGARYNKVVGGSKPSPGFVQIGRTKFELKPEGTAGGIILKPGLFGSNTIKIVDEDIPYSTYPNRVISAIEQTAKLTDAQKEFLILLVKETISPSSATKKQITDLMSKNVVDLSLGTINNDFGEVLGPIAVMNKGLLPIDRKSAKVNIPGRSNEPLLDYRITDKNKEYKISAKSGETTNTLKPSDVNALVKADKKLFKKWKDTPQYKVIQLLDENTTKEGPIKAGMWLKNNGYKSYFSWLKNDNYTEEIRQKCENIIVQISREAIDFTSIFADATNTKVFYVKFRIDGTGKMEWKLVETPKEKKNQELTKKRIYFRTKNYIGRPGDKLGFQV